MVRRLDTNTMDSITGSFLHELYSKHRNSTQAESMHLCAVMTAVVDLIQSQGLAVSPTSVFAAAMSSLDDDSSKDPTVRPAAALMGLSCPPEASTQLTSLLACADHSSSVHTADGSPPKSAHRRPASQVWPCHCGPVLNRGAQQR